MHRKFDTDVLVVGAGPIGLSLALELGLRGDAVTLVERDDTRGPQPRAKTLSMRSLEHLRRWGIADAVRAASPSAADLPTDMSSRLGSTATISRRCPTSSLEILAHCLRRSTNNLQALSPAARLRSTGSSR